MIFSPLNVEQELIHERMRQQKLMGEVHDLLDDSRHTDELIINRLKTNEPEIQPDIAMDEADRDRIFNIVEIRNICIRYRLRFLPSSFYKGEFPYEVVLQIKSFERRYGITASEFRMIAPDHAFELENINKDPLLFAKLSNGSYYFIHKWGKDLAWYKKFIFLPLQTPKIFFLSLLLMCALFSLSIPSAWMRVMSFESEVFLRLWLVTHFFIMFSGVALWLGISFSKDFSCNTWKSKYYNW